MKRWQASVFVILGASSYGLVSPFVKMAYAHGFSPQDVTSSQFVFAMFVLVGLSLFWLKGYRKLTKKDLLMMSGLGGLAGGVSVAYYLALSVLPASIGIVLLFQFTWIVSVIEYFVDGLQPSKQKWIAIGLVFAGTIFAVNLFADSIQSIPLKGLLLGLLSAIGYGSFLYLFGKVKSEAPIFVNSAVLSIMSVILISFVFPPTFLVNGSLGAGLWQWAIVVGLFGQILPPICFNAGLPIVGGSLGAILGAVELPAAVISSRLMLGEEVGIAQWTGICLILIGIVIAEWRGKSRSECL